MSLSLCKLFNCRVRVCPGLVAGYPRVSSFSSISSMEVRSEQGIMSGGEQFGVGVEKNPVQPQLSMQNMRLAFTPDGTAIYKQVNSSSPVYQGAAVAGEGPRGDGDGVVHTMAPHGLDMNMGEPVKRKRGCPRKYGLDGTMSLGLTPVYPSAAVAAGSAGFSSPAAGVEHNPASAAVKKKPKGRPPGSGKKQQMTAPAGIGFTPHIITINAGEDVYSKIMSFSHHDPHAVCILSANGAISNVTLRQAAMSSGTVTYERVVVSAAEQVD